MRRTIPTIACVAHLFPLGLRILVCVWMITTAIGAGFAQAQAPQGAIVGWGDNYYGQTLVPAPNSEFVAIAAGFGHSLGLRSDGSIVAWGAGEPGESGSYDVGQSAVPAPNTGFIAVAAGAFHSLGLKADGSIVAWGCGYYDYGQCSVPAPNADFIGIAGGYEHSLGLKSDGSIVAWGAGEPGESGSSDYGQSAVPSPNADFIGIAAGALHSLGLRADGSIVAWGWNGIGQTNVPAPNTGFIGIGGGYLHSMGLKADGSIVAWGSNADGQTTNPAHNASFIAIATGFRYSLGLRGSGSIVAWGSNFLGETNVPTPNADFIAVAAGYYHGLAIMESIGACCDTNGADQGCSENVAQLDCSDADDTWTENASCAEVSCECIPHCAGRECGDDGCGGVCGPCDDDGDGVLDEDDTCPRSDVGETIVIDGCDTGIANEVSDDGCTRADDVAECGDEARNHGQFVHCVVQLANGWKHSGAIDDTNHGRIMNCAARANIPTLDEEHGGGSNGPASLSDRAHQRSDTKQPSPSTDKNDGRPKGSGRQGGGF